MIPSRCRSRSFSSITALVTLIVVTSGHRAVRAEEPDSTRLKSLIDVLKSSRVDETGKWGAAIRELVGMGKPALSGLVDELDRTTDPRTLRYLGFSLRALGDPRAVPALIRAVPRTLVQPGSDFGLNEEDRELKAFLQKHDLDPGTGGVHVALGMPFREITGALKSLTGHRFNEDELNFVTLMGGPEQRLAQRRLFQRLAERWSVWWLKNRRKFTDDTAYFLVNLPQLPDLGPAGPSDRQFPTGAEVKVTGTWANVILGPPQPQPYYRTFGDLDSGLSSRWSDELPTLEKASASDVATYAKREGYDLRGIEYRPRDGSPPFYALECLDLKAWQIENHRFNTVLAELKKGQRPELDRPAGELLVDRDPATGAYHPENEATFLFITREGATGVLQVTSQITELFRQQDFGQPAGGKTNRGFYRGVQYQFHLFYLDDNQEPKPATPAE